MYHQIKLLAPQHSDKKCNILPVFYVLTKFDYTDYFKMKTVIAMKIWYQMFNLTMIVILSRHY